MENSGISSAMHNVASSVSPETIGALALLLPLVSGALQHFSELITDPLYVLFLGGVKQPLPGKWAAVNLKQVFIGGFNAAIGTVPAYLFIPAGYVFPDGLFLVQCLVIGFGMGSFTDATNSVLKFASAAKDTAKDKASIVAAAAQAAVAVQPTMVTLPKGGKATIFVPDPTAVIFKVLQEAAGTIDESGRFEAGSTAGTFQVVASSKQDPTKVGVVTVTVAA